MQQEPTGARKEESELRGREAVLESLRRWCYSMTAIWVAEGLLRVLGRRAQLVKSLPRKHKDLNSVPENHIKRSGYDDVCLNLSRREAETGQSLGSTGLPA